MYPLLLCSILALAAVLDRAWRLRWGHVLQRELLGEVERFQPGAEPEILRVCERHPGAFATLVEVILDRPPRDRELAVERARAAGRRAVRQLDRGLVLLEIVAGISPLLGLLGTVLGMSETFKVIAQQGLGDAGALSGGISEALMTTIVGLGIAIPAVVAQGYFSRQVDDLVLEIERHCGLLLERLYPDGRALVSPDSE